MDPQHTAARAFAWAGAVLFCASLAYFLFSYFVTFGEIRDGPPDAGAVLTNVALFTAFALHHSVFARLRIRDLVRRIVPPGLERSVYVWTASTMLIVVCASWRDVGGVIWQLERPWTWMVTAVQLAGAWVTVRGAAVIDALELAGVRQLSTPDSGLPVRTLPESSVSSPGRESDVARWEFRTAGPYGWVRHPIYLGWFLIVFAAGTMTMTRFVFAVVSSLYILAAIPLEERSLRAASSGAYDAYMRRVRWKLVPGVY